MNKYIQGGIKALGDMVKGRRVVHTTPTGHKVTDNFPHTGIVPRIIAARRARQIKDLSLFYIRRARLIKDLPLFCILED